MPRRDEAGPHETRRALWRMEAGGAALAAELGGLRLVVEAASHGDGAVRFLVRRERDGERSAGALIGSGMRATVAEAMRAAERVANRLAP